MLLNEELKNCQVGDIIIDDDGNKWINIGSPYPKQKIDESYIGLVPKDCVSFNLINKEKGKLN